LAKQGATVIGACRRVEAGKIAFADLNLRGSVEIMKLDLASLTSVRQFAESFLNNYNRLDGLVNNAGLICPQATTEDGIGIQFAINYLGPFLLTELLLETLKASAPSRIISLSSVMHASNGIELDFDDLDFEKRSYNTNQAYGEAKLAVVLQTVHLARRLAGTGVTAVSVHPGAILSGFGRETMPGWVRAILTSPLLKPIHGPMGVVNGFEGAQTTLHCLLDDTVPNHNGAYYSQHSLLYPNRENRSGGWPMASPNPHAQDVKLATKLYNQSLELVRLV